MSDLFKGLAGGGLAGLTAWILPSGFVLGLFWLVVYPQMRAHYQPFDQLTANNKLLLWVFAAVVLGVLLQALSTPMYRILEGYWWPRRCQERGVAKQSARKSALREALSGEGPAAGSQAEERPTLHAGFAPGGSAEGQPLAGAQPSGAQRQLDHAAGRHDQTHHSVDTRPHPLTGWARGLQDERIARFPIPDTEIAPTRLGNALRAIETYGSTRFCLDTQVLWSELCSLVPKSLQTELDRSRACIDFFIALVYLSFAFGVLSIAVAFDGRMRPILVIIGLIALFSTIAWYQMAIISTSYYASTVQALVNIGRFKLANELGLYVPYEIEHERRMWWLLKAFVFRNETAAAQELNAVYRSTQQASPPSKVEGAPRLAPAAGAGDQDDEDPEEGEDE
jgi:hypothetical protein